MIIGNINHLGHEVKGLPKAIQKGMEYLKSTDFSKLEDKTYQIEGDKIYVIVSTYDTKPKAESKAEVHKKFLDIQFIISGEEIIGVGYDNPGNVLMQEYDAAKDRTLFKTVVNEVDYPFLPGHFVVFFPTDVHRPGVVYNTAKKVRKAVVKIAVDLL
jgi:biofilm protein TabA